MRCECDLCYTLVSSGSQNRNFRSLAHAFVCDVKTKTNFTISLLIDDDQHLPLPLLTPNTSREHKIVDLPSNRIAGAGEIDFFVDQNPFESINFVAKHWKFSSECCVWRVQELPSFTLNLRSSPVSAPKRLFEFTEMLNCRWIIVMLRRHVTDEET